MENSYKKKKILILASGQFGYSTTTFKHCEFAADQFDLTYMGWDYGLPKIELPNVDIKYVSRSGNLIVRNMRLLNAFHSEIGNDYDLIFTNYFRGASLVRLWNCRSKFIVYVDTLAVMKGRAKRLIYNLTMRFELLFFKNVALISRGIGKKLLIDNFIILPLGGECYSSDLKSFENLSLLYVGTLDNRNILDCVKGFHKYIEICKQKETDLSTHFTIVGDSPYRELAEIREYIQNNNLEAYIQATGYINRNELKSFFEKCNIGVSYIPIRSYYQYQPPTKTYEYLISGLPVIATATYENKNIVKPMSGIIINDTIESFFDGILKIDEQKLEFRSDLIRMLYSEYIWERIVKDYFVPLILKNSK